MEILYRWIDGINDVLWSYLLVALLLGCAVWFTLRTRGVQFRMLGEMVRVLGESAGSGPRGEKHVSSFQAFAVSLASRVDTGNLAGVATAIAVGGPGAALWLWVIALLCAACAFVESSLAQLFIKGILHQNILESQLLAGQCIDMRSVRTAGQMLGTIIETVILIEFKITPGQRVTH